MSVEAVAWALDARRSGPMPAEHRLTLAALADYANAELGHQAWPSVVTLAERLGITTRSVRRSLAALLEAGVVVRGDSRIVEHYRADRRPTVYRLVVARGDGNVTPSSGVTPTTARGDARVRDGVTPASAKPRTEPLENNPTPSPRPETIDDARLRRRPDGSCRLCDDVHPLGVPCSPVAAPPPGWRDAPPAEGCIPGDEPLPLDDDEAEQ